MNTRVSRAPFQVLVLPYRRRARGIVYAALQRSDDGKWQGVAGGGQRGETHHVAAERETLEEIGVRAARRLLPLQSIASIPAHHFKARRSWPASQTVVYEYAFGVDCSGLAIRLSDEHCGMQWGAYERIWNLMHWQSNQTALWELREVLRSGRI